MGDMETNKGKLFARRNGEESKLKRVASFDSLFKKISGFKFSDYLSRAIVRFRNDASRIRTTSKDEGISQLRQLSPSTTSTLGHLETEYSEGNHTSKLVFGARSVESVHFQVTASTLADSSRGKASSEYRCFEKEITGTPLGCGIVSCKTPSAPKKSKPVRVTENLEPVPCALRVFCGLDTEA